MLKRQKQYWLHRINGGENGWMLSLPLLNNHNILSVGWSCISSEKIILDIKEQGIVAINQHFQENNIELQKNRYCLLNFVKKMKRGDLVIVPTSAYFSIYKIVDNNVFSNELISNDILNQYNVHKTENNELFYNNQHIDLGFYRQVQPIINNIPRNEYAVGEIYKALCLHSTNSNITSDTIMTSIGCIVAAFKKHSPLASPKVKVNHEYSRWTTTRDHSWAYRIFRKSNDELMSMRMAYTSASCFTYKQLKKCGANWDKKACEYLYTNDNKSLTIKEWSNALNSCQNWIRLNQLMALNSCFESYLSAIIKLAIESDPGILIEAPHAVDGIRNLKYDIQLDNIDVDTIVRDCTSGEWGHRNTNLKKIFMTIPELFLQHEKELEEIRKLRNNLGHAFGRDIDITHSFDLYKLPQMDKLSSGRFKKYQELVLKLVKEMDYQVMKKHIGNFQPLYYCHSIREEIASLPTLKSKAELLKRRLYEHANEYPYAISLCEWVVSYYENL